MVMLICICQYSTLHDRCQFSVVSPSAAAGAPKPPKRAQNYPVMQLDKPKRMCYNGHAERFEHLYAQQYNCALTGHANLTSQSECAINGHAERFEHLHAQQYNCALTGHRGAQLAGGAADFP